LLTLEILNISKRLKDQSVCTESKEPKFFLYCKEGKHDLSMTRGEAGSGDCTPSAHPCP
jgi:hypothetical protein